MLPLKSHESLLSDALKKGLTDGDPNCREYSRNAFPFYNRHFPVSAAKLLTTLSPNLQKTLRDLAPDLDQSPILFVKCKTPISRLPLGPSSRQESGLSLRYLALKYVTILHFF